MAQPGSMPCGTSTMRGPSGVFTRFLTGGISGPRGEGSTSRRSRSRAESCWTVQRQFQPLGG